MTMPPSRPQLSDEQRRELKAVVKAQVRDMLGRRDELIEQETVMRKLWQALVDAPKWSIVTNDEKPADTPGELWSMIPTVTKE
jgi:hypothetical protein